MNNTSYANTETEYIWYNHVLREGNVKNELLFDTVNVSSENYIVWNFYKCRLCPFKTKKLILIKNHLKRHEINQIYRIFDCMSCSVEQYKCNSCEFKTSFVVNFRKHKKTCFGKKKMKIDNNADEKFIYFDTSKPSSLTESYGCINCNFSTHSQLLFIRHFRNCSTKNTKDDSVEQLFPCPICSFVARRKSTLDGHLNAKHLERPRFNTIPNKKNIRKKCSILAPMIKDLNIDYDQELETEKPILSKTEILNCMNNLQCWKCSFRTNKTLTYVAHIDRIHRGDADINWYYCSWCLYKTLYPHNLARHKYLKHHRNLGDNDKSWLRCSWCLYKTVFPQNLERHKYVRHRKKYLDEAAVKEVKKNIQRLPIVKEYKCTICNFKVTNLKTLKSHIATNHILTETVTCYRCELCEYKTLVKIELEGHIFRHHVDSESTDWFQCKVCEVNFQSVFDLKKHVFDTHIL